MLHPQHCKLCAQRGNLFARTGSRQTALVTLLLALLLLLRLSALLLTPIIIHAPAIERIQTFRFKKSKLTGANHLLCSFECSP